VKTVCSRAGGGKGKDKSHFKYFSGARGRTTWKHAEWRVVNGGGGALRRDLRWLVKECSHYKISITFEGGGAEDTDVICRVLEGKGRVFLRGVSNPRGV